jgi:hypothetical protein
VRQIKLSEELDRYNSKLFPPQFYDKYLPYKYRLIVDGQRWEHTIALPGGADGRFSALLWGDAVHNLKTIPLADLALHFSDLSFALTEVRDSPFSWTFDVVEFRFPRRNPQPSWQIVFKVDRDFELWTEPFSVAHLSTAIQSVTAAHPELEFINWQRDQKLQKGFGISTQIPAEESLQSILSLPRLAHLEQHIEAALVPDKLIRVQFAFPDSIKSACEQYLIYFIQFLRDLGIHAGAELKEEAHSVLFTVRPKDETQALSRIWEALQIYLQIPALQEFESASSLSNNIAVSQLKANVSHLQGQLHLAAALLQAKEASISAKDAEIATLQDRLDLRFFSANADTEEDQPDDAEPLIEGFVDVKKFELAKGSLEINAPQVLRKLKELIHNLRRS